MQQKTLTLILALTLLATQALGAETTNTYEWGTHGYDNQNTFDRGSSGTRYGGNYIPTTVNFGSELGGLIWDINSDGVMEYIVQDGGVLKVYNQSFEQISSVITNGIGNVELIDGEFGVGEKIIVLTSTTIDAYKWDSGTLTLHDSETLTGNVPTANTGLKCEADNLSCFFAGNNGVTRAPFSFSGSWRPMVDHTITTIANYQNNLTHAYPYVPAIGDFNGDSYEDIAFYCQNGTNYQGIQVVDANGNDFFGCKPLNPEGNNLSNKNSYYPVMTDLGKVLVAAQSNATALNGSITLYDSTGAYNTKILTSGTPVLQSYLAYDKSQSEIFILTPGYPTGKIYSLTSSLVTIDSIAGTNSKGLVIGIYRNETSTDQFATSRDIRNTDGLGTILALSTETTLCVSNKTVMTVDYNRDGYLDIIETCQGQTLFEISNGTPASPITPPSAGQPTYDIINTNASVHNVLTDTTTGFLFAHGNILDNTAETSIFWTINPDTDHANPTSCFIHTDYTDSTESGYSNLDDLASGEASKGIYISPCNSTNTTDVQFSVAPFPPKAYRYKVYRWDENTRTNFDGITINGKPAEGYIIQTNETLYDYLNVTITDAEYGNRINLAKVAITTYYRSGSERVVSYTGTNGQDAKFLLPAGSQRDVTLEITKTGYAGSGTQNCVVGFECAIQLTQSANRSITYRIRDADTYAAITGANITLYDTESSLTYTFLTDGTGYSDTQSIPDGSYWEVINKEGYETESQLIDVSTTATLERNLNPAPIGGESQIVLTIGDKITGSPIIAALVELEDPLSGLQLFEFTDLNGKAYFNGIPQLTTYTITVSHEDYITKTSQVTSTTGTSSQTILLQTTTSGSEAVINLNGTRVQTSCNGLIIPSAANIECDIDADCPTGECTVTGKCATFNWSWCDANGRIRNNRCYTAAVSDCTLDNTTNWMLSNFLWLIVILIIIVALAFIVSAFRRR